MHARWACQNASHRVIGAKIAVGFGSSWVDAIVPFTQTRVFNPCPEVRESNARHCNKPASIRPSPIYARAGSQRRVAGSVGSRRGKKSKAPRDFVSGAVGGCEVRRTGYVSGCARYLRCRPTRIHGLRRAARTVEGVGGRGVTRVSMVTCAISRNGCHTRVMHEHVGV